MGQVKINKVNRHKQDEPLTVYDKAIAVGVYIVKFKASIRQTSMVFDISKSRVHELVKKILPLVNIHLSLEVEEVLAYNKSHKFSTKGFDRKDAYKPMKRRKHYERRNDRKTE